MDEDRVLMVAGEASADAHAAALLRELKLLRPSIRAFGLGGSRMAGEGADLILDLTASSVVGVSEILPEAGTYIAAYRSLMEEIKKRPPQGVILLDLPDFNIFLAGRIKKASPSSKIVYYISPQVWAWRPGRVHKIARRVDAMLVLFPFEVELYERAGMDVEFVGHPLKDTVTASAPRDDLRREFGVEGGPVVAMLPGSRRAEIERYLPVMARAAARLGRERGARFLLARAPTVKEEKLRAILGPLGVSVKVAGERTYDVLAAADAAMVASGTATLETAIMGVPMVVLGAVSRLSYEIGVRLSRVEHYSLPNVIAGKEIVPELIQMAVTPERVVAEIADLLDNGPRRVKMREELAKVRDALGPGGASQKAALAVHKRLWTERTD